MSKIAVYTLVFVLFFATNYRVSAADILHAPLHEKGSGTILIFGRLENGDQKQFNLIAQQYNKAAVLLSSQGGNLAAGIEIGKTIRMRNFSTGVAPSTYCASACAMAWLGGTKRYMAKESRVGFHAAYTEKDGLRSETGVGNAVIGAYATQIGLPLAAVIYITSTKPNDMRWLTASDARHVGIDIELLEIEPAKPPAPYRDLSLTVDEPKPAPQRALPLKPGENWLVIASRADLNEAVSIAQKYKLKFPATKVLTSANGRFAVTLGQFSVERSVQVLEQLKLDGELPSDSYFSMGTRLVAVAWQ